MRGIFTRGKKAKRECWEMSGVPAFEVPTRDASFLMSHAVLRDVCARVNTALAEVSIVGL